MRLAPSRTGSQPRVRCAAAGALGRHGAARARRRSSPPAFCILTLSSPAAGPSPADKSALGADPASDGKVPILQHDAFVLTESLHCADYVAALAPADKQLLPAAPHERARTGLFLEAVGKFVPAFYALLMRQEASEQAAARAALLAAAQGLAAHCARQGGPFLLGKRFSFGDLMLFPFVERLCVVQHYRGFSLDEAAAADASLAPLVAWRDAMLQLPCVQATLQPPAFFVAQYEPYASGKK